MKWFYFLAGKPRLTWEAEMEVHAWWYRITRLWCRHRTLHVIRCHANVRRPDMKRNELYVDEHNVYCYIECVWCRKIMETAQTERLYAQSKDYTLGKNWKEPE